MPIFNIHGRVLPEGVRITIEDLPIQTWENKQGKKTTYLVNIIDSHIGIEINAEEHSDGEVSFISNQALELARAAVDGFCFNRGWGLTVTLDRFFDEDGREDVLLPFLPGRGDSIGSYNSNSVHVIERGSLDALYSFMASNPSVGLAFNDLIAAITSPRFAEINCARCIEGIMNLISISDSTMTVAKRWEMMRTTLNISSEYLQGITDLSRKPRHGKRHYIPPDIIEPIINRSWVVMERFIEYAKTGVPLSVYAFPVLIAESSRTPRS